jgi:acyl-coenzyme A thioesterase PaaI-like protein
MEQDESFMDEEAERRRQAWRVIDVTEGDWAGWKTRSRNPFEDMVGPFYWRDEEAGRRIAFRAEQRHMNGAGFMHGGLLMTFADYALFCLAREILDRPGVTATLHGDFTGSARVGDLVECTGDVVHGGGSLVFIRGQISCAGQPLMHFSGVIKKVKPRPRPDWLKP